MSLVDLTFPALLQELHELEFDYADGKGIDFEAFVEFLSIEETRRWIRAWTGNSAVDGTEYRVFGQDGTGGYAAFWCVRPNAPLLEQPIVFFGSEGELGVIASWFSDYLWLLAGGFGPFEAVSCPDEDRLPNAAFTAFAEKYSLTDKRSPQQVLQTARLEFPSFAESIHALCG